jgi:hypothetical protein
MPEYGVHVTIGFEHELDYLTFLKYCESNKQSFRAAVKKLVYDKLEDVKNKIISDNKNKN